MRKKVSLFFIVVLLVVLAMSMIACDKSSQNGGDLPEEINPSDVVEGKDDSENATVTSSLKFSFPEGASSVFKSLFTDEFDISAVEYCVIYTNVDTKTTTEGKRGNLSVGMIEKITDSTVKNDDGTLKNFVDDFCTKDEKGVVTSVKWQKGHYTVWVKAEGIEGSFALHLQDKLNPTPTVRFSIDAKDNNGRIANIQFNTVSVKDGVATVQLEEGVTFANWDEFTDAFRMSIEKDSAGEAKALESVTVNGKKYDSTSGFPLVIDSSLQDKTMTTAWTNDTVTVKFNLAVPSGAIVESGKINPNNNAELQKLLTQSVRRNIGKAKAPQTDTFNVFTGYYFAGWYLDADTSDGEVNIEKDTIWNFSKQVGAKDITLIARWTKRTYSFTLYTMGGEFKSDVENIKVGETPITDDATAKANGLTVVKATSSFGIESKTITRIEFSGLEYGVNYSDYVANVTVAVDKDGNPSKSVYLRITDIKDALFKGNGEYVKVDSNGVYGEYQCENPVDMTKVNGQNTVGYIKWVFNADSNADVNLQRLSNYYIDVVFKNGITKNADGSLCIEKIADKSLSELVIPKELIFDGERRAITEIASYACMNLKALTKLDLSGATELKEIGEYAFAHAPHLKEVVLPTTINIESVGQKLFYGSEYENNYYRNHGGKQFIVIGHILYKYVGQTSANGEVSFATNLNLGVPEYYTEENTFGLTADQIATLNQQLAGVTSIADGAFANAVNLESITLGDKTVRIENGAFADLTRFAKVEVGEQSELAYVGENAFDGTLMLGTNSGNYVVEDKAIIIGKMYYRFIDKTATGTLIPGNVRHIAPYAFDGCDKLNEINFAQNKLIMTVGKRAFTSTKWIRSQNGGFVIVDGNDGTANTRMLVDFYSTSGTSSEHITIPSDVTSIGEETFYLYANNVRTIKFGTNINNIENYAFKGATSLESLIFTEVKYEGGKLVGAPSIAKNAFADENGNLIHNATFFFTQTVLEQFDNIISGKITTTDQTTLDWVDLYRLNKDNFEAEDVAAVYINTDVVDTNLLKTEAGKNAFETKYGNRIEKGLIVRNNTGVDSMEDLDKTGNEFNVVLVEKQGAYAALYEEGVTKYVVTFKYHGETKGCHINVGDEHLYVATVHNAIKGYDANGSTQTISTKKGGNFYLTGFVSQGEEHGAPLFYTSYKGGTTGFVYVDIDGTERTLPTRIENFDTATASNGTRTATVTIDFYGLGTYKFTFDYVVKASKIKEIVQDGAISIPLNGDVANALGDFKVRFIGQDGSVTVRSIDSGVGFKYDTIDTSVLGFHQLVVSYNSDDVEGYVKTFTLAYSIVLESDASLFEYGIVNQKEIPVGEVKYAGEAAITRCSANRAETVVLPATCTIDGKTYLVTDIANNAFEGFTTLKAIYLGANIKNIGSRAFANCTALEDVYTVQRVNEEFAKLTENNFTANLVEGNVYNATVINLDGVAGGVVAIGSRYEIVTTDGQTKIYNVVGVDVKNDMSGVEVFLPDTLLELPSIKNATINSYSSKSGVMFRVVQYANDKLEYIGTGAFESCGNLKKIDLTKASKLNYIGPNAFASTGLTSIDLSANTQLKEINMSTFAECRFLVEVKLPVSIETIADHAFYNCSALTQITGVTEVKNLANNAYEGCGKLTVKPSKKTTA